MTYHYLNGQGHCGMDGHCGQLFYRNRYLLFIFDLQAHFKLPDDNISTG